MAKDKLPEVSQRHQRPARTPEQRELQLMALAVDLSEQRLREGTASSAEIVYWLKQASPQAAYERENLKLQNEFLRARKEALESESQGNLDYKKALDAIKGYRPHIDDDIVEGDYIEK